MARKVDWLLVAERFDDLKRRLYTYYPMRMDAAMALNPMGLWLYDDHDHAVIVCCLMAAMTPAERREIGVMA